MSPKIDPILRSITLAQLALVEDQLSNNEVSTDEELHALFVQSGLTEAQASRAISFRSRYLLNIYAVGDTPILNGEEPGS